MTSPALSAAQKRAVLCDFADALVTAGAGSGKTRVLSERFVHLVREGHADLRRLAALTFTDKASAQMRDRIARIFRERQDALVQAGGDVQELARLGALRADVEFAPISTIHAFCALLLRQHAVEAGVDPSFQVLDAVEAGLLEDDAAFLAENRLAEESPDLIDVLHTVAGDGREELLSLLTRLRGAGCRLDAIRWKDGGGDVLAAHAQVEEALAAFAEVGGHLPEERQPMHADAVASTQSALARVAADDEASPFLAAQAQALVRGLTGPRTRAYTTPRKGLETALGALTAGLLDAWGPRVLLPALVRVLATYDAAYRELKDERSALDFTDLELRARDLLRTAQATGRPLDLAPGGLLVDEFQDTNPLQAEILGLLRGSAAGVPQFSVGDPKQSIYRFRRADVHVILRERERIGAEAVFPMNASYRACAPLVAGINALGEALFAGGRAGVAYEPLEAAATFRHPEGPVLDFAVIDAGKDRDAGEARELEAAWIAERIATLVEGATPRLHPDAEAPLKYGDIAVLFRAGTSLPIYEAALEARGVPFLTQKSRGFFQAEEITDLVHVLRVVHNPGDRFALACTATGPAMAATDQELLRWFAREPDGGTATAWERMVAEAEAGGPHRDAVRTLGALRLEAAGGSLATAVERALVDLGLYEAALLQPGGDRAAANLRKAVELARRLDRGGRRGLDDLLRHLATLREREMGEADAPIGGESDDVVRLTTVHGAKGLEYPVVFVADVGRGPVHRYPAILFDGATQVAAKVADPLEGTGCVPGGYDAIRDRAKQEEGEEELRLLYVAMTRAEERLVLSGWCKGAKRDGAPSFLRGWGGDLWDVLGADLERGTREVELPGRDPAGSTPAQAARLRLHVVDGEEIERPAPVETAAEIPAVTAEALVEARALWEAARAPVAPLGDTRYVVSVSELLMFAESPPRYYHERVVLGGARADAAAAWDAPSHDVALGGEDAAALARAARAAAWDEPAEVHAGLDRAALGRAVHLILEHVRAGDTEVPDSLLARAVEAEGGDAVFAAAARDRASRFLASGLGARLREALSTGADVRREVALHARIRFPGGAQVGGFDSLLVKGSIDLWLPTADGVLIVDHKTNRRGGAFRTPEDLAAHYAWQLRLYALATERALGADVAGARLALLDPSWSDGATGLEVEIDVSGARLEEARKLCRAFAIAELEGRYPEDWRSLLA